MKLFCNTVAALTFLTTSAFAGEMIDEHLLERSHDWALWLEVYDNDVTSCSIRSQSQDDVSLFDFTISNRGEVALWIWFPGADFSRGEIDVDLDIDYTRWTLEDIEFSGNRARAEFDVNDPAWGDFLNDLENGGMMALKEFGRGERNLTTWSLRGSANIIREMLSCVKRIHGRGV